MWLHLQRGDVLYRGAGLGFPNDSRNCIWAKQQGSTLPLHTLQSVEFSQDTGVHSDLTMPVCSAFSHNQTIYFAELELFNLSGSVQTTLVGRDLNSGNSWNPKPEPVLVESNLLFTPSQQKGRPLLCDCSSTTAFVTSIVWHPTNKGLRMSHDTG